MGTPCQQDDWNGSRNRIGLELMAECKTIHAGHEHLDQNHGGALMYYYLQGCQAVAGFEHWIAFGPREIDHLQTRDWIRVNNHYLAHSIPHRTGRSPAQNEYLAAHEPACAARY